MELINHARGFCEIRQQEVEILMLKMRKAKGKTAAMTPLRCQNAAGCPKGSFCRFVNPLTTRLPVVFADPSAKPGESAEAS